MNFKLDKDINALYIRLAPGAVARTVEIGNQVYVDVDQDDEPLGVEFINAEDFLVFLREHGIEEDLPPRIKERVTELFSLAPA